MAIGSSAKLNIVIEAVNKATKELKSIGTQLKKIDKNSSSLNKSLKTTNQRISGTKKAANVATNSIKNLAGAYIGAQGLSFAIDKTIGSAIRYEEAFAGVIKTVDASEKELNRLRKRFRELSKEIPITADEFARIGELAGQLGVKAKDIDKFAKTIAELGVTTNLSIEEASMSIARFSNIMGTSIDDVERLGSTIVDLGNNLATTESEIVGMSMRLAGAGKIIGLTESQVLGLAGALSSVGIRAEAGGTAISTVMIKIASAVADGGDVLNQLAAISETSSSEFARHWKTDPINALLAFINGLAKAHEEGQNVFQILENLGVSEIRQRDALLRLAGAQDLVNEAVAKGAQAWEENNALAVEASKKFGTTASQIQLLKNNWEDLTRSIGELFIPILNAVIPMLIEAANAWANLGDNLLWVGDQMERVISRLGGLPIPDIFNPIKGLTGLIRGAPVFGTGEIIPDSVSSSEFITPTTGQTSSAININITGNTIMNDDDAEMIGNQMISKLQTNLRT